MRGGEVPDLKPVICDPADERFNRAFTEDAFAHFLTDLGARAGVPVDFHLSETPCFFPTSLMDELVDCAQTMVSRPARQRGVSAAADDVVPERFRVPRTRVAADVPARGLRTACETRAGLEGRLVELQAFPSLYGFQLDARRRRTSTAWKLDGVTPFFSAALDRRQLLRTCRRAIVGVTIPPKSC